MHLDGYLNIDHPPSAHTVQVESRADEHADLLSLRYEPGTVAEVRLHHVFEHFPRPMACALVLGWRRWLVPDGLLRIEVPDFARTAMWMRIPGRRGRRWFVGLRHLYGSNEADWAVHYEGWSARTLRLCLELFGYRVTDVRRNHWKGTHNCEVFATAGREQLTTTDACERARRYLSRFLVDESEGELHLLDVWLQQFRTQLERM